jgi:hypothetical protein
LREKQPAVSAVRGNQRLVRAVLDDAAAFEHEDAAGPADGRGPVGDDEHGAATLHRLHSEMQRRLAVAVEIRDRLVHDEDRRVAQRWVSLPLPLPRAQ